MMALDYSRLTPRPTNWDRYHVPRALDGTHVIWLGSFKRREPGRDPLRCLVSVDLYEEGPVQDGHWLHISVSRGYRLPTWPDMCRVRDELGFADRLFVQLIPPASHWLNLHEYTLHLWSRIDAESVPRSIWDQIGTDGSHYRKEAPCKG